MKSGDVFSWAALLLNKLNHVIDVIQKYCAGKCPHNIVSGSATAYKHGYYTAFHVTKLLLCGEDYPQPVGK